jgi:hypothetical protein
MGAEAKAGGRAAPVEQRDTTALADAQAEAGGSVYDFINQRLQRLSRRLSRDGDAPLDRAAIVEVRFLRDIAWLAKQRAGPPPSRRQRLAIPLLFLATALVITALVVLRLPSIRVDADLLASALTMRMASPIQLTSLSPLTLLQATEFRPAEIEDPVTLAPIAFQPPLELRPAEGGSLTLSSISIPDGALLSIQATPDPGAWRVSIEHAAAAIGATLAGQVDMLSGGATRPMAFGRGSLVQLQAGAAPSPRLDVVVAPQRIESLLAGRRIPVTALQFEEAVQEALPGSFGIVQGRGSSVIEGSIFNVALGGREVPLRARDAVEMELADGNVRELRLEAGGIRVSFSGEASELRLGRFGGMQTLRPSYLEWLAEHHALKLAWAGAAWVFALFLGGMRWWQASGA